MSCDKVIVLGKHVLTTQPALVTARDRVPQRKKVCAIHLVSGVRMSYLENLSPKRPLV